MSVTLQVVIPVAVLMALAWAIPRMLEPLMPETLGGLILNGGLSSVALVLVTMAYLFLANLWESTALLELAGYAPERTLLYFLKLGLMAGIIWGPMLVFAISTAPRRWKENTW